MSAITEATETVYGAVREITRLREVNAEMLRALEDAELRCTQAKIASTIGKKNQSDFLRGELERIQAVLRAAIEVAA